MRASKLGLLILILAFGGAVETAWTVRQHLDVGPLGCRALGGRFYGPSFSFDERQRHEIPPGTRVEVVNAFGSVEASLGEPGAIDIALQKVVYRDSEARAREFASQVALTLEQDGAVLRVSTNRDAIRGRDRDTGLETHLRLRLPPGTPIGVRNEHGRVEIVDAAAVDVDTAYEALVVRRVGGAASVKNRHGDVTVESVGGALLLNARYGDVEVRDVTGSSTIDVEHGNTTVGGIASLEAAQRYGDLTVEDATGDLHVRGEHLGVNARRVGGRVAIETSYRDVAVAEASGDVTVKNEHGEVAVSDTHGAVSVQTSYQGVTLAGIGGPADVTVSHGGLHAEKLAGGIRARVEGDDVTLDGFKGGVEVEASRAGVRLVPDGPLADAVRVTAHNGSIRFEVPPDSRFELEAVAKRGEVEFKDLPGFTVLESGKERIVGRMGEGGLAVKLEAERGDVSLSPHTILAAKQP
jgi:DUF4097 and DUF4098 domain-containing protein YvlB